MADSFSTISRNQFEQELSALLATIDFRVADGTTAIAKHIWLKAIPTVVSRNKTCHLVISVLPRGELKVTDLSGFRIMLSLGSAAQSRALDVKVTDSYGNAVFSSIPAQEICRLELRTTSMEQVVEALADAFRPATAHVQRRAEPSKSNLLIRLIAFILANCRGASASIAEIVKQLGPAMQPAVLGGALRPLRPANAIHATRIGPTRFLTVNWRAKRIDQQPLTVVDAQGRPVGEAIVVNRVTQDAIPEISVDTQRFLEYQNLSPSGIFYVVRQGTFLFDDELRELIFLSKGDKPFEEDEPFSLVCNGYYAAAWHQAIAQNFNDSEILSLQSLMWKKMAQDLENIRDSNRIVNLDIETFRSEICGRANAVDEEIQRVKGSKDLILKTKLI
jgi:hypothetical protein